MSSLPPLSEATELFDAAGLVDLAPALAHPAYRASVEAYRVWIESGRQATMAYLERGEERRRDPRSVFAETKSVLAVARVYSAQAWGDGVTGPKIARYARGSDYHDTVKRDLTQVCERLSVTNPGLKFKVCVDTSAVLERTWGALAGLGWIGKNGMLIHPRLGSYFLIGIAFLSKAFGAEPTLIADRCGACEKCLRSCPTGALDRGRTLDSAKCLSYQTLEHRGPLAGAGPTEWVAGCDLCQEVCPFNFKSARAVPDPERTDWADFRDPAKVANHFKDHALSRVREDGWARNIARLRSRF